jgi:hypothetical protein
MFDFLFGGSRKLALIRELLEQRLKDWGLDDMESRLYIKQMGNLELMGSPEAGLVTIMESVIKLQKKGGTVSQIIQSIENFRSQAHDENQYRVILKKVRNQCLTVQLFLLI